MGKSKELSIDLKEHIIDCNKSGKSLGAISKQLHVLRSTVQTAVSIKCLAQLCHCHNQEENTITLTLSPAAERILVRMVNQKPPKSPIQVPFTVFVFRGRLCFERQLSNFLLYD